MGKKELIKAIKQALIQCRMADVSDADMLAEELVTDENETVLRDFLKVITSTKKEIIREIAEHKAHTSEIKKIVKELSELRDHLDDEKYLLKIAKRVQK